MRNQAVQLNSVYSLMFSPKCVRIGHNIPLNADYHSNSYIVAKFWLLKNNYQVDV